MAFRGGMNPCEVRRSGIASFAFSTPLPLHVAFLGVDGGVLLDVPIGATLPRKDLVKLSEFLQVPFCEGWPSRQARHSEVADGSSFVRWHSTSSTRWLYQ